MNARKRMLTALVWLLFCPQAWACVNTVGVYDEEHVFSPGLYEGKELADSLTKRDKHQYWLYNAELIAKRAKEKPNFENLNQLGLVLLYQKNYAAAIMLFVRLEKIFPKRYEVAANLGTVLELASEDEVALRWIRLGIQRNPEEHYRTEWLHVRILEHKIALRADPQHLKGRSVAGVAFGDALIPAMPAAYPAGNDGKPVQPFELNLAFNYQLYERMFFVSPKDPVVANLLNDWATLHLAGGSIESARELYRLANRYGTEQTALITQRLAKIEQNLRQPPSQNGHSDKCPICLPD
jgi:tetratricopeptide (TPR) repeat protein